MRDLNDQAVAGIRSCGDAAIGKRDGLIINVSSRIIVGYILQKSSNTDAEKRRKIKDVMTNPDNWEKIGELTEKPPTGGGESKREWWKNKITGDELEKHVLTKPNGRPMNKNHPHWGPVDHFPLP